MRQSQEHEQVLIAPEELQELIKRLTEQQVEGISVTTARSLEGIAADTGVSIERLQELLAKIRGRRARKFPEFLLPAVCIAVIVLSGLFLWRFAANRTADDSSHASIAKPEGDFSGLIRQTDPADSSGLRSLYLDPTFVPLHSMPRGLGLRVEIGDIVWRSGPGHNAVFGQDFGPAIQKEIEDAVVEALTYAWDQALRRKILSPGKSAEPGLAVSGDSIGMLVTVHGYRLSATVSGAISKEASAAMVSAQAKRIARAMIGRLLESRGPLDR